MSDLNDDKREAEDVDPLDSEPAARVPRRTWRDRLRLATAQRNMVGVVGASVCALILVIIIAFSLTGRKTATAVVETVSAATARMDALEKRIAQVEALQRTPAQVPGELTDRLAALENSVAALPTTAAPTVDPVVLSDLRQRVDSATGMVTELTNRLDAVEMRGGEGAQPGAPVDTSAITALRATTTQLQQSLNELKTRVDAAPPQSSGAPADVAKLAALERRMGELETKDVDTLTKRAASALAVANLVRATQGSGPFKTELGAMAMIAPSDPALAKLSPYAESGLPTEDALSDRFGQLIQPIIQAEDIANDTWWLERMWTNFVSQITVRQVGDQPGLDARAIVGRAEQNLRERNLRAAAAEVAKLQGAAAETARPWREAAEARLALDGLVTDINGRLLAEIATEE